MADRRASMGFLGFGEAGFHLARGLRSAGAARLIAFDIEGVPGAAGGLHPRAMRQKAAHASSRRRAPSPTGRM